MYYTRKVSKSNALQALVISSSFRQYVARNPNISPSVWAGKCAFLPGPAHIPANVWINRAPFKVALNTCHSFVGRCIIDGVIFSRQQLKFVSLSVSRSCCCGIIKFAMDVQNARSLLLSTNRIPYFASTATCANLLSIKCLNSNLLCANI